MCGENKMNKVDVSPDVKGSVPVARKAKINEAMKCEFVAILHRPIQILFPNGASHGSSSGSRKTTPDAMRDRRLVLNYSFELQKIRLSETRKIQKGKQSARKIRGELLRKEWSFIIAANGVLWLYREGVFGRGLNDKESKELFLVTYKSRFKFVILLARLVIPSETGVHGIIAGEQDFDTNWGYVSKNVLIQFADFSSHFKTSENYVHAAHKHVWPIIQRKLRPKVDHHQQV